MMAYWSLLVSLYSGELYWMKFCPNVCEFQFVDNQYMMIPTGCHLQGTCLLLEAYKQHFNTAWQQTHNYAILCHICDIMCRGNNENSDWKSQNYSPVHFSPINKYIN